MPAPPDALVWVVLVVVWLVVVFGTAVVVFAAVPAGAAVELELLEPEPQPAMISPTTAAARGIASLKRLCLMGSPRSV
jgi:hypothetical protein